MGKDKTTLKVEVTSPHGYQSLEQFKHHLNKIASEAQSRWGIDITVTELSED